MAKLKRFKLRDVLGNPFRRKDAPFDELKIRELTRSFTNSGLWPNIIGRVTEDGKQAEIAFGHHRIEAAKRFYKDDSEAEIILTIEPLDDSEMLRRLIDENLEHGGSTALTKQLALRAVIEAYAAGVIELEPPGSQTTQANTRYAPSIKLGHPPTLESEDNWKPFTALSLGNWLGWSEAMVSPHLFGMELQERGLLGHKVFAKLGITQGKTLAVECRSRWNAAEKTARKCEVAAAKLGKQVADLEAELEKAEPDEKADLRAQISDLQGEKNTQLELAEAARAKGASDIRVVALQAAKDFVDGKIGTQDFKDRIERRLRDDYKPDPPEPADQPEEDNEPKPPDPPKRRPTVQTYLIATSSLLLVLHDLSESDLAEVAQASERMTQGLARLAEGEGT